MRNVSLIAVFRVWTRYLDVFCKGIFYSVVTTFVTPLVYLASFAFGMARLMPDMPYGGIQVPYRSFVYAGILGQTLLFQAFFEGAYGGFVRMYYQKVYKSISLTPITLSEILSAELLWIVSRSMASAMVVVGVGVAMGEFSLMGALSLLPVLLLSAFLYASIGLLSAALARTIEELSYPQLLIVLPMTLFCGVFYPLSSFDNSIRTILELLPLSATIDLIRAYSFNVTVSWKAWIVLLTWTALCVPFAMKLMRRRVVR